MNLSRPQKLTLLSRTYCHLCDDMMTALSAFQRRHQLQLDIEIVDIDLNGALEAQYGDKVPVLLFGDGVADEEICHYFLDEPKLSAQLQKRHAVE